MSRFTSVVVLILCALCAALPRPTWAVEVDVSLRGSPNSMIRQHDVAKDLGFDFVREAEEIDSLLDAGVIMPVEGNAHYVVDDGVSYPYARPEVRLFIERLAEQYHEGTGERLVVTSLMRPASEQPRNSHNLSVHPTGIAIDFRVSSQRRSRAWLESVLLRLEGKGLLDITRERWPPHYHVALFPGEYISYLEELIGSDMVAESLQFDKKEEEKEESAPMIKAATLPPVTIVAAAAVASDDRPSFLLPASAASALLALLLLAVQFRSRPRRSPIDDGTDPTARI